MLSRTQNLSYCLITSNIHVFTAGVSLNGRLAAHMYNHRTTRKLKYLYNKMLWNLLPIRMKEKWTNRVVRESICIVVIYNVVGYDSVTTTILTDNQTLEDSDRLLLQTGGWTQPGTFFLTTSVSSSSPPNLIPMIMGMVRILFRSI